MKKLIMLAMVLVFFVVTGCVGSKGWVKKDGQPVDQEQFPKDREECNRGWGICLAADILLTVGILSLIHYGEARHCMTVKGYVKEQPKEETATYKYRTQPLAESKSLSGNTTEELFIAGDSGPVRYYHRSDCSEMAHIHQNRVKLTREQAEARGLKPCPICKP